MDIANKNRLVASLVHDPSLWRQIIVRLPDQNRAEDVLQQVLILVYQNLGHLREPAKFRAWVFQIMKNEVYKNRRRQFLPLSENTSNGFCFTPSYPIEISELQNLLKRTLQIKNFYTRTERSLAQFLISQALEGKNSKEICQNFQHQFTYGIDYVYTLLCRIRKKLKDYLTTHGY